MIGQTASICPADKKLYALRDVTATVPSRPLIVASIMSKKLAESLDSLVLDVKFGTGAFMKTKEDAEALGEAMREVGIAMGVDTSVCYNPMNEPLGHAVGNALEVAESLEILRGCGPSDLREITLDLAQKVATVDRAQLENWLDNGSALQKFENMVTCQGGDAGLLRDFSTVHPAALIRELEVPNSGVIEMVDAETVGRASLALGAGRGKADDEIDFSVGFDQIAKVGDEVKTGDCVARIHASSEADADIAVETFWKGFRCA
jgi:thymidine phosphorylase